MSIHHNLNLNMEFRYDTPKGVINLFEKKMKGLKWDKKDKQIIPFGSDIEHFFDTEKHLREQCLQTFHFQKQDYLGCPEFRKFEGEFYCFHLSRTIRDIYQGVYELIVWLAQFSRTNGYLGEYHEPESNEVNLIFGNYGKVTVKSVSSDRIFQMSVEDFEIKPVDQHKIRIYDEVKDAIYSSNYSFAEIKINELLSIEPEDENFQKVKKFIEERKECYRKQSLERS